MSKKKAVEKEVVEAAPVTKIDKKKVLDIAISQIGKRYGDGTIMYLGESVDLNVEHSSTGSLMLDLALGIGGLPKGRIIEVYGAESSGKTTLALHAIAEAQKAGGYAAFIDVEHALDPVYAKNIGVKTDELLVSQPDTGEQALEIIETLVRSGAIDIVVLDSVAAMATQAEIDGDMGQAQVGVQARLMSQAMRKLTAVVSKTKCVCIFINQIREKIGVLYGNPETTPGGRALKYYASVRIDVRKGEPLKNGTEVIGNRTKCKVVKNKVAPPFKTAEFDMLFGEGISKLGEIIDCAVEFDIVKKSGSWFSYDDMKIGQGKDKVRDFLKENPELCDEIEQKVREVFAKNSDLIPEELEDEEKPEATAEDKAEKTSKKSDAKAKKGGDDDFAEFSTEDVE
ncbi:MAG: recombinase RecA [Oscillospiraceae bacterium]|nr:recombinase RecA [Oscillospiraceae bacterium]